SPQRKRSWDIECPSFPGERPLQFRKAGLRTPGGAASLSGAWLRCGEGFQDTSGTLSLTAEEKTTTVKHLELSPRPKQETSTSKSTNELTDITWSSSGSDLSDEDKTPSKLQRDNGHGSRINRFCKRSILCSEDGASEDKLIILLEIQFLLNIGFNIGRNLHSFLVFIINIPPIRMATIKYSDNTKC
uniref:DNA repair-scaffolding protein-like n=1 Tax=Callithrix jacchus TaxID=9483 RepID=UPI0023DD2755